MAANRNGGMLRLIASRHDDDDDGDNLSVPSMCPHWPLVLNICRKISEGGLVTVATMIVWVYYFHLLLWGDLYCLFLHTVGLHAFCDDVSWKCCL